MTLKQRALLDCLKMLAVGAGVGTVVALAGQYLGIVITGIVVSLAVLAYLIKIAYEMRVSQLEFEQQRIERALKEGK